jgi:hypothetical protein
MVVLNGAIYAYKPVGALFAMGVMANGNNL